MRAFVLRVTEKDKGLAVGGGGWGRGEINTNPEHNGSGKRTWPWIADGTNMGRKHYPDLSDAHNRPLSFDDERERERERERENLSVY